MSNDESIQELLAPTAPHDDLDFEALSKGYNFRNVSERSKLFVNLLLKEIEGRDSPVRVLDIGCGTGISTGKDRLVFLQAVAEKADELWGVEPDESIVPEHDFFANFQHALLEDAELPENYFDLAYSFMVMEHVEHPKDFLKEVHRCLKPGGVYIFITPNGHHYFTLIAGTMKKLRLDEFVLRLLVGKSVDDYHYPVQYRCNRFGDIKRLTSEAGYSESQLATVEINGPRPYLPGPLRIVLWLMMKKRSLFKNPKCLLNLYVRMRK